MEIILGRKNSTSQKANMVDEKKESNLPTGRPSSDTALSAILGSLRLYDDDLLNNPASTKYKTTTAPYDIVIRINSLFDLRS
jgi:hypothetical protein